MTEFRRKWYCKLCSFWNNLPFSFWFRKEIFYRDKDGRFHNENGPARINEFGDKFWYKHGILHRADGPAVELTLRHSENIYIWFLNGKEFKRDKNIPLEVQVALLVLES